MCGHKGILHGGASAATLDQFFGLMNCLPKIQGFTGQLNLSYRKIILCPSTVLIRGTFDRVERRKHYFKAVILDEVVCSNSLISICYHLYLFDFICITYFQNDPCVEAECLYIESNVAKTFDNAVSKLEQN